MLSNYGVPDYPGQEQILAGQVLSREARPQGYPREVFEDIAKKTIKGLQRLLSKAWDVGIDFEKAIYELTLRERFVRDLDQKIQEQVTLARAAARLAEAQNMGERYVHSATKAAEEGEWLTGVNRSVIAEYQECRRGLEEIRDARLKEYAKEWEQYLSSLESPTAEEVRSLWSYLETRLWAPEAAPTDDGGFRMVWDRGPHHLQIEVLTESRYDWFYRNRDSGMKQFEEDLAVGVYSPAFDEILDRITAA